MLIDGHHYWIMRLNSKDAEARGIEEATWCGPSTIAATSFWPRRSPNASPPAPCTATSRAPTTCRWASPGYSPDTAGCINLLTPKRFVTPTSTGMAPNSCLIQVEKWEGGVK